MISKFHNFQVAAEPYIHQEPIAVAGRAGRAEDDDEVDPEEIAYVHEEIADVQVRLLSPMSLSNLVSGSFRKFPLWLASHFRIMTSFFIIQ